MCCDDRLRFAILEIIEIDTLEGDGALDTDSDVVVDHQARQHGSVDQDDAHVAEAACIVGCLAGEAGGGDEHALVRRLAVQGADEGLDCGASNHIVGRVALGLEVNAFEA